MLNGARDFNLYM